MIEVHIPIKTKSNSNIRTHFMVKAKQVKAERAAVARKLRIDDVREAFKPLLVVTLTRVSPRRLDDDNIRGALKAIRDQVATALGIDDRTPLVAWHYCQERGEPAVLIRIERIN